jgi:hypothetical protein
MDNRTLKKRYTKGKIANDENERIKKGLWAWAVAVILAVVPILVATCKRSKK